MRESDQSSSYSSNTNEFELDLNPIDDGLKDSYQKAKNRLSQLRSRLTTLFENQSALDKNVSPEVRAKVNKHPENTYLQDQIITLKDQIYNVLGKQIALAYQRHKNFIAKKNEMAQLSEKNILQENISKIIQPIILRVCLTIQGFFSSISEENTRVLNKLGKIIFDSEESNENHDLLKILKKIESMDRDKLLDAVNRILKTHKKEDPYFYVFVKMLSNELQSQLHEHAAFKFNKNKRLNDKTITFNEEDMINLIKREYETAVSSYKKNFLDSLNKLGKADSLLHDFNEKVMQLTHIFEKEKEDLTEIDNFCNDHNHFAEDTKTKLQQTLKQMQTVIETFESKNGSHSIKVANLKKHFQSLEINVHLIEERLDKIVNISHSIAKLKDQNRNLLHFEDRINMHIKHIDELQNEIKKLVKNILRLTGSSLRAEPEIPSQKSHLQKTKSTHKKNTHSKHKSVK